jgi:hypothetical protein
MEDLDPNEFKKLVIERSDEVLAILYSEVTERWCEAHLNVAKADCDVARIKAQKHWLEVIIEHHKKREAENK